MATRQEARRELAAKLLDSLQGPAVGMTREDWDSIRREALEGLAGEEIGP
jgi:antitoxin ParD1/3/4